MKYRTNPRTGEDVSLLGFGAMRLPMLDKDTIDEKQAIEMIRYAIDAGVNYIDTAYIYHEGLSEVIVGKALKDGYRDKVRIATKLPTHLLKVPGDKERLFSESLQRLDIDYIDNYLAHGLDDSNFAEFKEQGVIEFMQEKKNEGKLKNICFSFHGESTEFFKEVIDFFDWDACQIQLNYMDADYEAGVEGLRYAASKGIEVIIMEPLRGGKLTYSVPPDIMALWNEAEVKRSPVEWAFRWVANFPEVTTILSGMSTMEQVKEDVEIFSRLDADSLSEAELAIIDKVASEYRRRMPYGCTACKYCMPCPIGIAIPEVITYRNEATMYNSTGPSRFAIANFLEHKPSECTACKHCEEICPQHLAVSDIMTETAAMLE